MAMDIPSGQMTDFPSVFPQWQDHFETTAIQLVRPRPEILLELEGSLNHLDANLNFVYDGEVIAAGTGKMPVREKDGVLHQHKARSYKVEIIIFHK